MQVTISTSKGYSHGDDSALRLQAVDECDAEKATYQADLLDTFQRRTKKLEEDLKILEAEGSLDSVKPQVMAHEAIFQLA